MRIILLKDVRDVGKKHEVKEVKAGYARNFLFPRELAKLASPEALKWLETQKEIESKLAEEELKTIQDFASNIDGVEVVIPMKIGEEGQLFESINAQKIAEKMKEQGLQVKKSQIILSEPIKELGEFPIKVKLDHNLEAEIKVIISEEKK